jgi:hypothetical protein
VALARRICGQAWIIARRNGVAILTALPAAPRISVVLPVYNGEAFLGEAIESILGQTFTAFELLVIDDGSNDATAAIADSFADRDGRVRVMRRAHKGLSATLNAGIAEARGEFVARMDADDISVPERFAKQAAYLDTHAGCVVVGAWMEVTDDSGQYLGLKTFVESDAEISAALLRAAWPIAHPTVMARRDAIRAAGGYDAAFYPSEDLALWLRLADIGALANIAEPLLRHRRHRGALGVRERDTMTAMALAICNQARSRRGLPPLRGTSMIVGTSSDARYYFECTRTALIVGPRAAAIRYAAALLRAEPRRLYCYAALIACLVPKQLLCFLLELRRRWR